MTKKRKISNVLWELLENLGFDLEEDNNVSEKCDDAIDRITEIITQPQPTQSAEEFYKLKYPSYSDETNMNYLHFSAIDMIAFAKLFAESYANQKQECPNCEKTRKHLTSLMLEYKQRYESCRGMLKKNQK